jgi:phosphoenolpyruvate carboxykinase (ATP)
VLHVRFRLLLRNLVLNLAAGRYAEMLADRMSKHNMSCWLINTDRTGGKFSTDKRCPLKYTRRIADAVHSGELLDSEYETFGVFGPQVPTNVEGVPRELLNPRLARADKEAFERGVRKFTSMFQKAFKLYEGEVKENVRLAGPRVDWALVRVILSYLSFISFRVEIHT